MDYADLVAVYRRLAATRSNNEKTAVLAEAFADADAEHLPMVVTLVRGKVFAPWEDADLGVSSSLTRRAIAKATGVDADELEERWRETGDLGSAAEWAVENAPQRTLFSPGLTVRDVHDTLRELAGYEGEGSEGRRVDAVAGLVADADAEAARYVVRTALGHMRLGVGEGTVRDAVAVAFLAGPDAVERTDDGVELHVADDQVGAVERAHQVTNDFRVVAETARDGGREALAELDVEPFRPVGVMLARKGEGLREALLDVRDGTDDGDGDAATDLDPADLGAVPDDVLSEFKYDGVRVQLHRDGEDVRVFTRRLEDVTDQFPDVVAAVRRTVTADPCILDGELRGYDPETRDPVPFQEFSRRIRRKYDVAEVAEEIPVVVHLFDAIHVDGETLLDAPLRERLDRLAAAFDPEPWAIERAEHRRDGDVEAVESFYREALAAGHEGLMVKNLDAPYEPGRRVGRMLKVKPVMEPLDLVVTRAKYSEGRRSGNLGRLYLACRVGEGEAARRPGDDGGTAARTGEDDAASRDEEGAAPRPDDTATAPPAEDAPGGAVEGPDGTRFLEVGRLSTGYTDEELAAITDRLEDLVVARDGREVRLRPELVVEVAYEEIQASPEYASGFALRFPRFEGVREDLSLGDVDSYARVRDLYEGQ